MKVFVTCSKGIAPILEKELYTLGFPIEQREVAGVWTETNWEGVMRLNLILRTAQRVLIELRRFECNDPNELYIQAKKIFWENYIPSNGYFTVKSSVAHDTIRDTRFANVKVKDAVVDTIRKMRKSRPTSGPHQDRAVIFLHWHESEAILYIDSSGEPLARRSYRLESGPAPIQETLAAAMVLASGWDGESNLINPMCGTGTLAIEALLYATNTGPGLLRENFGFMHLENYNEEVYKEIKLQVLKSRFRDWDYVARATDRAADAIHATTTNAGEARVGDHLFVRKCNFNETKLEPGGGIVLFNPPYGERLEEQEALIPLYQEIGTYIKHQCEGYKVYVISSNIKLLKQIGLATSRDWTFYNGPLECRLNEYVVYDS